MHAVRQHDGNGDVVRVAGGFQRPDDVVGVVRHVGKPGKYPFVEAMRLGERALSGCLRAAVMPVNIFARRAAELPDASIRRPLGVPKLDRADRLVDRHAGVPELQAETLDDDIGVADVMRLADQPIADGQRQAEPLVGQRGGEFGRS